MKTIRQRVLRGEMVCGTWVVLGSSLAAEIAGNAGFDWVLLDMEHGMGGHDSLLFQLQALEGTPAAPLVRVANNDPVLIKRALDLGPSGIMVPQVHTAAEAERAVRAMRYPPQGIRGVSPYTRPGGFGRTFPEYYASANDLLLGVVQIESEEAVRNADAIAAVDGVDVLFIGPLDLSTGMGIMKQFHDPRFLDAVRRVVDAARTRSKAAGIILVDHESVEETVAQGFTFVGRASDGGALAAKLAELVSPFLRFREHAPQPRN
jgi:4-hydroxy-2-oxoheptanedioate aldolase